MRQPSKVGSRSASDLSTPYPMQLRQTRTYRYEYESHVTASRTDETVPSDTCDHTATIFAEVFAEIFAERVPSAVEEWRRASALRWSLRCVVNCDSIGF